MNLDSCTPGQRQIITTLDKPLMVSAGAGSGKTFTLTQRIAYALTEPGSDNNPFVSHIDQILAITFTKKAAAELKSRIKAKLLELGLTDEALKVDDAWISTIHGMCSRVLREHALELGVDSSFEVLSETDANRLKDEAFDRVLFALDQSDNEALKSYVHTVGITSSGASAKSIQSYVSVLSNKVLALPGGFDALYIPEVEGNPAALMREMVELGQEFVAVSSVLTKPTKTDAKHLEACEAALEKALAYLEKGIPTSFTDPSLDVHKFAKVLFSFPKTSPKYRVKDSDPTFFADYRSTYAHITCTVESALSAMELRYVAEIARRVHEEFQELKGPRRLDNVDLLRATYDAFVNHPNLAHAYQQQFRMIMIDEFQDTDELQVALLSHIAKPGFTNVCTVGDAQQSIYRFRGADVSVFYAYQSMLEAKTEQPQFVNLPDNFRSHADVLSFVDTVFSQPRVFGERFLSLQPKGHVNEEPDATFNERSRIAMALYDCPSTGPGVSEGRKACALRIAQHFAELYDAGVSPADMTLLLGSMSNVEVYAQALRDLGFECLVAGGSTFSEAYEVGLVQALLEYFANSLDSAALYQVLSSPLFSLSDEALLSLATTYDREGKPHRRSLSEGFISLNREIGLLELPEQDKDMLDFAYRCLSAGRIVIERVGLAAGVQEVLRTSGWYIRLEACGSAEAQAIVGNLYKALRMIEDIEALGLGLSRSVKRFIDDCKTLKLTPGTLSTASSEFVKIMTIHSSKGLEFPHVAVAEIRLDAKPEALLAENIQGTTYACLKPQVLDSFRPVVNALKEYKEPFEGVADEVLDAAPENLPRAVESLITAQELSEARRLLYVALTRASKSLFLGITYRGKKEPDYTGKGVLEDLYSALQWQPCPQAPYQYIDYGGTLPLRLEYQVVDNEFKANHPKESFFVLGEYAKAFALTQTASDLQKQFQVLNSGNSEQTYQQKRLCRMKRALSVSNHSSEDFLIPGFPPQLPVFTYPLERQHKEVCSYSSLPNVHKDTLAGHHKDELDNFQDKDSLDSLPTVEFGLESSFEIEVSPDDDATALGSAFHRIAQYAIDSSYEGNLACPDHKIVDAQISLHQLSTSQKARLKRSLDLWFNSTTAQNFATHAFRYAEVPFMVTFGENSEVYLEGEIDGLACDFPLEAVDKQPKASRIAYLVDYKTGGNPAETESELYHKHLLQAQCYAYALLKQGFSRIEARFVRVEQLDSSCDGEPQIQEYQFEACELPSLESIIYQAYKKRPRKS